MGCNNNPKLNGLIVKPPTITVPDMRHVVNYCPGAD